MPHRSENPCRLDWITYRPSCGYEHLADPDERIIPMVCPDGVEPLENDGASEPCPDCGIVNCSDERLHGLDGETP